jgi:hypothetical protein
MSAAFLMLRSTGDSSDAIQLKLQKAGLKVPHSEGWEAAAPRRTCVRHSR